MLLIPVHINDGAPRNAIGHLISLAVKFEDGINAAPCRHHDGIDGVKPYLPDCKDCQRALKARARWTGYLQRDLGL